MKPTLNMPVDFSVICDFISPIRMLGDLPSVIEACAPLNDACRASLSFCSLKGSDAVKAISGSRAGTILCLDDLPEIETIAVHRCLLTVARPRLSFIQCLDNFFKPEQEWGIHSTAVIESNAVVSESCTIGPGVFVGHHAEIGEGSIIDGGVHIEPQTIIGKNVYVQAGAVIGCQGQGFERDDAGILKKFPQTGRVVLEDNVEIGANSTIVRGTLSETRIGRGSKIGHLTDIGHNVRVGKHVFISAGGVVCGSAVIGDYAWLAPKCCIRNKVVIGRRVTVGLGAVVTGDVSDGVTVVGIPARPLES